MAAWLDYFRGGEFAGGCFLSTVRAELNSRPDRPVREMVVAHQRQFLALLEREIRKAQEEGDLDGDLDAEQLAFELEALGSAANQQFQLMRVPVVFDRAATAIAARLSAAAVR